jgi:hypothetical protein
MSHLPPDKFGAYLATGSKRQIEGPAIFFEVDQSADLSGFRMEEARQRCQPHRDGSPRRSVYMAVFNVLPRVPLGALRKVYLTTPSGLTLGLAPEAWPGDGHERFFLYQELGPVYPRVASRLGPKAFCELVTAPDKLVTLPRLAFIDLKLGSLASDTDIQLDGSLPYQNVEHLRECLRALRDHSERMTKIVYRGMRPDILFSMVRSGLFVGDTTGFRFFPMPSEDSLEAEHTLWWHSAQAVKGY